MKSIINKAGSLVFWLTWPALWLYLRNSQRTRALIICGNEFLALTTWLGTGDYSLPGGGLHRGEKPLQGLMREVAEETGIDLLEEDIVFLQKHTVKNKAIPFTYHAFVIRLASKPTVKPQKHEITGYAWLPLTQPSKKMSIDAAAILAYWQSAR